MRASKTVNRVLHLLTNVGFEVHLCHYKGCFVSISFYLSLTLYRLELENGLIYFQIFLALHSYNPA